MDDDVFRSLKTKLTWSIVAILAAFLIVLLALLNASLISANVRGAKNTLTFLMKNNGERARPQKNEPPVTMPEDDIPPMQMERPLYKPEHQVGGKQEPPEFREEKKRDNLFWQRVIPLRIVGRGISDYAAVAFDQRGEAAQIRTPFLRSSLTESEVLSLAQEIFGKGITTRLNYKYYAVKVEPKDFGYLMILLDREGEIMQETRLALSSAVLFILSLGVAFAISMVITVWAVKPVKLAFENQKRFIADVSHELKTPIAVIAANIDVLSQELPENKWLEYIRQENRRMGSLVKDLLYLAKNDAGRISLSLMPLDLRDAVEASVNPFENVCAEQNKTLSVKTPHEIIAVNGDEEKIKQLVIILVDNAIKNSMYGDSITVSVGKNGGNAFVKVHNTGPGIQKQDLEKIFERFYRADTSRARNTGGYGLGLSIAKSIAQSHKGKITVESEQGKFAEFTFTLPPLSV